MLYETAISAAVIRSHARVTLLHFFPLAKIKCQIEVWAKNGNSKRETMQKCSFHIVQGNLLQGREWSRFLSWKF